MNCYHYNWKEVKEMLPERKDDSHKGTYGKLLLIAGSRNMAGAAFFAAKAAYRAGAGLVYIYTAECNRVILQQLIPEAVLYTYDKPDSQILEKLLMQMDAVAIGPGIGMDERLLCILEKVMESKKVVVADADALNLLSEHEELWERKKCQMIITPHMKEMSRLTRRSISDVIEHKMMIAAEYAAKHQVITVLKDHHTIVTDGNDIYLNQTGNHGMATGGSGDVLTGVIASMLAQKLSVFDAAKIGVYMHGKAGDDAADLLGPRSVMASDIADYVFRGL